MVELITRIVEKTFTFWTVTVHSPINDKHQIMEIINDTGTRFTIEVKLYEQEVFGNSS